MYELTLGQFTRMLENTGHYFEKANAHATAKKYDVNVLMNERLAPDQYPFARQIQIACDNAKGAAGRLAGKTPPVHEDTEKTLSELKQRVEKTVTYMKSLSKSDYQGWEERPIEVPWMPGKYLTGMDYLARLALPNFYFHMTTAYAILRKCGVDLGKSDFIGNLPFKDKK